MLQQNENAFWCGILLELPIWWLQTAKTGFLEVSNACGWVFDFTIDSRESLGRRCFVKKKSASIIISECFCPEDLKRLRCRFGCFFLCIRFLLPFTNIPRASRALLVLYTAHQKTRRSKFFSLFVADLLLSIMSFVSFSLTRHVHNSSDQTNRYPVPKVLWFIGWEKLGYEIYDQETSHHFCVQSHIPHNVWGLVAEDKRNISMSGYLFTFVRLLPLINCCFFWHWVHIQLVYLKMMTCIDTHLYMVHLFLWYKNMLFYVHG